MIGLLLVKKLVKHLDVEAEAKVIDSWVLGRKNGWPLSSGPVKLGVGSE